MGKRMTHKQKRNRLPNFTPNEESFLLSLAYKHVNVIESKLTDGHIWVEKRKIWENIDIEFGKKFGLRRGWKNLREKYDNLKRKLRRMESREKSDGQAVQKVKADENIEKLATIVGFTTDYTNDGTFANRSKMNNDVDETVRNFIFPTHPRQDSEPVENEDGRGHFNIKEELRSAEELLWDSNRNKREAEKYRWEIKKHILFVEKQKWELKEARLKTKILQMKLKNLFSGDGSRSPFSTTSEDHAPIDPKSHARMQDSSNTQNVDEAQNFINIDILSTNIKIEPSLDITDIGDDCANDSNEDRALNNRNEKRKSTDVEGIVLAGMCKKFRNIQPIPSDEQQQWELALKNDMVDTPNNADSGFLDAMQLENADISSYDDNESDTCNVPSEEFTLLEPTTDDSVKVSTDEHDFLNLLNKHKLQHYLPKLKEMNIGSDYLQYIQEIDIRDICVRDIGARIRFRALLNDWRTSHRMPKTAFKPQMNFDVAKEDHCESIAGNAIQCRQKFNQKKVLPEAPYRSVLDFKMFVELIKNSEAAYQKLIAELIAQNTNNSVNFLKTSWRRIMSDHVAQHFCWTGTLEKPAIRTLSVTKALKEAYQRKFAYCTNDDFQRTIQQFFQHAKTRLQKKQNYEKLKAANTTL